jgi:hypothetical protein
MNHQSDSGDHASTGLTSPKSEIHPVLVTAAPVEKSARWLEPTLLFIVTAAMIFLGYMSMSVLRAQVDGYKTLLDASIAWRDPPAALVYAGSRDYALMKTATIFMGFVLIFVGCLYVLRAGSTAFRLASGSKLSLDTTSPGLVMVALGVALILATIRWNSDAGLKGVYTLPIPTATRVIRAVHPAVTDSSLEDTQSTASTGTGGKH